MNTFDITYLITQYKTCKQNRHVNSYFDIMFFKLIHHCINVYNPNKYYYGSIDFTEKFLKYSIYFLTNSINTSILITKIINYYYFNDNWINIVKNIINQCFYDKQTLYSGKIRNKKYNEFDGNFNTKKDYYIFTFMCEACPKQIKKDTIYFTNYDLIERKIYFEYIIKTIPITNSEKINLIQQIKEKKFKHRKTKLLLTTIEENMTIIN